MVVVVVARGWVVVNGADRDYCYHVSLSLSSSSLSLSLLSLSLSLSLFFFLLRGGTGVIKYRRVLPVLP